MKRRPLSLLIIACILVPIHSIGFGYHTFSIRTNPDFAAGVYPTSLLYQFEFPVPNINGWSTEIDFRIDSGISFRELRQTPDDGTPYILLEDKGEYTKKFISIYDEMNLVFGQGLFSSPLSNKELLKLWLTLDLHFEKFFENLNYLTDPNDIEGLFHTAPLSGAGPAIERFPNSPWIGQPEMKGNRSYNALSISLGIDVNLMEDKITRRNGMNFTLWTRFNPSLFDIFNEDKSEFIMFWAKLDLAYTPYYLKMNGSRDTAWLSFVFDNSTTYQFTTGNMIPYYLQGGHIWELQGINTKHNLVNRTSISIYGPQINSYDCYPYITAFADIGWSFGQLLNSSVVETFSDFYNSYGIKVEFVIFDIANFYYEFGYIQNNVLNQESKFISKLGFSFGV